MPFGLLGYPVLQSADILCVRGHIVPVGKDNAAHVEVTREIARRFNGMYGEVFPVPQFVPGDVQSLVGTDGQAKMSKSLNNAIFLRDAPDVVKAKVLDVDVEKERISLGVKQLKDDPAAAVLEGIHKGDIVTCVVSQVQQNGIEVKVGDVLTGFIRRSELARDKSDQRPDRFAVGEKVDARVQSIDRAGRRLTLTVKGKEMEEEKQAMAEYGSSDSGASLGDILGAAIRRRNQQAAQDS